jgi:hypothetical protein
MCSGPEVSTQKKFKGYFEDKSWENQHFLILENEAITQQFFRQS